MSHQILHQIKKEVERGNVSERTYDNLSLFKYTQQCVTKNGWNNTNKRCRGIILNNKTGQIIARSFDKFFNLEERPSTKAKYLAERAKNQEFQVTEKLDGSMIAIWFYDNQWMTSTPGAIDSEQAIYAREKLFPKYELGQLPIDITYVCEMIAPNDREQKVINYGEQNELVMLTAFGSKWEQSEIPFERVKSFAHNAKMPLVPVWKATTENFLELPIPENTEGYVVRLEDGFRFKVKSFNYIRAFRLIKDFSSKHIFEYIQDGNYHKAANILPEDKRRHFDDVYAQIMGIKGKVELELLQWISIINDDIISPLDNMKEVAQLLLNAKKDIVSLVFMTLRKKNCEDYKWKIVKRRFLEKGT